MTTLDILGGDWRISFDDENVNGTAGLRKIEYISGVVRTTNEVYSAVADAADEFQAMGFKNPMLPTTPNAYTLENKYFMPRSSMEWLKEGAITADWTLTGSVEGDGVLKVAYTVGLGTDFAAGDIGRQITQSGTSHTGCLLDFDQDPDGTKVAWIRPDDPSTDTFSGTGSLTALSGTGSVDTSVAGISGITKVPAIQVIGSVPDGTEVYVVQDRIKLPSSDGTFQWWTTDSDVSLGIISILVMTQNSGVTIADEDLEVFARRYTALYDNFRLNVAAGGFQALPLASSPDINNTTGYQTFTGSSGSNTFEVGNGIYVGATWATATKRGILTAVGGTTADPVLEYYLVGDLTDFANLDAVKEYDFSTDADGDATCTAAAPGATTGGPTDSGAGEGGTVTIALGATTTTDHDGDGTAENYSITVDAQTDVPIAKVYERLKYVTRRGADASILFGAGTDVPGETYRGIEGVFEYDANTGTMTNGDNVTISTRTNFSARLVAQNTTPADSVPSYITLTDIQTSLTSAQPADNDVVDDETGDDVTLHAGGTLGIQRFTAPKASPFGTFTGSQIFGARGVRYINPAGADTQAYILTDDSGFLREPPNTVAITGTNTRAGDRIFAARDTGVAGVIDKDRFGGMATPAVGYNQIGDNVIRVAGTIDSQVATAGYVRVVETSLQQEHRYVYQSRTAQASGEFTLKALTGGNTGTATGGSGTTLVDDGRNFLSDGVEVGMLVRNTTALKTDDVYEVTGFAQTGLTANDTLNLRQLYGAPVGFVNTDTYEINLLIQTYANTDDLYDPILDLEEDVGTDGSPGTASNTLVKTPASNFGIVVNVRQGKVILPFTQNVTVGDSGASFSVVRQDDTIAV